MNSIYRSLCAIPKIFLLGEILNLTRTFFRLHPLWPSWSGLVWVATCAAIAYLMVRTEEEHERYCGRTPRFLGVRKG